MTTIHTNQGGAPCARTKSGLLICDKSQKFTASFQPPRKRETEDNMICLSGVGPQRGGMTINEPQDIKGTLATPSTGRLLLGLRGKTAPDDVPTGTGSVRGIRPSVPLKFGVSAASRGRQATYGVGPCHSVRLPNGPRKVAVAQKTVMAVVVIRPGTPLEMGALAAWWDTCSPRKWRSENKPCESSSRIGLGRGHEDSHDRQSRQRQRGTDLLKHNKPQPVRIRPSAPESLNSSVLSRGEISGLHRTHLGVLPQWWARQLRETTCPGCDSPDGGMRG